MDFDSWTVITLVLSLCHSYGPEAAESESGGLGPNLSRPEWRLTAGSGRAAVAVTEAQARSAGLFLETRPPRLGKQRERTLIQLLEL